jgi:hypothetical protein
LRSSIPVAEASGLSGSHWNCLSAKYEWLPGDGRYAPDFVDNAGGPINVAGELQGHRPERARASVESGYRKLRELFTIAREDHISPAEAADRFAESRIDRIGRMRLYWVAGGDGGATRWDR